MATESVFGNAQEHVLSGTAAATISASTSFPPLPPSTVAQQQQNSRAVALVGQGPTAPAVRLRRLNLSPNSSGTDTPKQLQQPELDFSCRDPQSPKLNPSKRFTLLNSLGDSLYGRVYRGFDNVKKRLVALKLSELQWMSRGLTKSGIPVHENPMLESSLLLQYIPPHPNIIRVYDVYVTLTEHWLSMEFSPYGDLLDNREALAPVPPPFLPQVQNVKAEKEEEVRVDVEAESEAEAEADVELENAEERKQAATTRASFSQGSSSTTTTPFFAPTTPTSFFSGSCLDQYSPSSTVFSSITSSSTPNLPSLQSFTPSPAPAPAPAPAPTVLSQQWTSTSTYSSQQTHGDVKAAVAPPSQFNQNMKKSAKMDGYPKGSAPPAQAQQNALTNNLIGTFGFGSSEFLLADDDMQMGLPNFTHLDMLLTQSQQVLNTPTPSTVAGGVQSFALFSSSDQEKMETKTKHQPRYSMTSSSASVSTSNASESVCCSSSLSSLSSSSKMNSSMSICGFTASSHSSEDENLFFGNTTDDYGGVTSQFTPMQVPQQRRRISANGQTQDDMARRLQAHQTLCAHHSRRVQNIFRQLVSAVYHLHELQVCHMDISMENILVFDQKQIKLTDFGLARLVDHHPTTNRFPQNNNNKNINSGNCDPEATATAGRISGKISYASPEILACKEYDPYKVDVFACGVVLFCCFTGLLPFEVASSRDSAYRLLQQDGIGSLLKALHISYLFPAEAQDLLNHMLDENIESRFSIAEVANHSFLKAKYI